MELTTCEHEAEVISAVKMKTLAGELGIHAAQCSVCEQAIQITGVMGDIALTTIQNGSPMPNFQFIWLKSQYTRREKDLSLVELIALLVSSLIAAVVSAFIVLNKYGDGFDKFIQTIFQSTHNCGAVVTLGLPAILLFGLVFMIWFFALDSYFLER
ncbi:MAG: hypothetical protein ACHQQQ_14515 [Bacteroidota bacterium]